MVTNRLAWLDYGFCGIEGSVELVADPRVQHRIPRKCSTCVHLAEDGWRKLVCAKDAAIWGGVPRGLDYTGRSEG